MLADHTCKPKDRMPLPPLCPKRAARGGAGLRSDGTTEIDVDVICEGKNFKGCALGLVLRTIGRSVLEKAFVNSVKAIEARNFPDSHPSRTEKMYV